MKKLLTFVIVAGLLLTGCVGGETIQINYEAQGGLADLEIDTSKTKLQYPTSLHLEVMRLPNKEPRVYVKFAEEYLSNGQIKDFIRLTVQAADYDEYMAEEWDAPYFPLKNICDGGSTNLGEHFGCETADGITSYYMIDKQGDTDFVKKFFVETGSVEWPLAEMRVELTEEGQTEEEFKAMDFSDEQKKRMQIAEDMMKTLQVK
ncbi:hypothetical protein ACFL3T_03955 [Patescibacteria group bacterium]